ncbi:MAG: hypothetical protein ACYTEQ_28125, partial [Planctomycetota bacterium]
AVDLFEYLQELCDREGLDIREEIDIAVDFGATEIEDFKRMVKSRISMERRGIPEATVAL